MKPLAIVTTYGRIAETKIMLESLRATTRSPLHLVIVDNNSGDAMREMLQDFVFPENITVDLELLDQNIGCPRGLNLALQKHRLPGQDVIKLDNDIKILPLGFTCWVDRVDKLIADSRGGMPMRPIGLISACYEGIFNGRTSSEVGKYKGGRLFRFHPVIGHAVWHDGDFMDKVSYFDVLAADHLYGFEDLIMSHKANLMGFSTCAWEGWQIENIQRHSALGNRETVNSHVKAMRPLYQQRIQNLINGGSFYTDVTGRPKE